MKQWVLSTYRWIVEWVSKDPIRAAQVLILSGVGLFIVLLLLLLSWK